jgi:hypothetical protein
MRAGLLGMIAQPWQGNKLLDDIAWCADNGAYGKNYPGHDGWWTWLMRFTPEQRSRCAFAVAPDVVSDAERTLALAATHLPRLRAAGFPAALAAQDGLEQLDVPWDAFDVLFLGGSTEFKLGGYVRELTVEAKRRGKAVHMGRVNSLKRLRYARLIGCDSADGTGVTFGPDVNLPKVLGWVRDTNDQYVWSAS